MIAPGAFIMIYFAEGGIGRCLECWDTSRWGGEGLDKL